MYKDVLLDRTAGRPCRQYSGARPSVRRHPHRSHGRVPLQAVREVEKDLEKDASTVPPPDQMPHAGPGGAPTLPQAASPSIPDRIASGGSSRLFSFVWLLHVTQGFEAQSPSLRLLPCGMSRGSPKGFPSRAFDAGSPQGLPSPARDPGSRLVSPTSCGDPGPLHVRFGVGSPFGEFCPSSDPSGDECYADFHSHNGYTE